jgi:anti-sigma factor RsiW
MSAHLRDEQAQALVDGLLDGSERADCRAHAADCADCQLLVDSYRALAAALEDLEAPAPPAGFTAAVLERIGAAEAQRAWERRLAFGILGAAAGLAVLLFALSGAPAWAPLASRLVDALGAAVTATTLVREVASPLMHALRLQIALGCAALGLPLLFALSRLVPRGAEATA